MATILPRNLPLASSLPSNTAIPVDGGTQVEKATPQLIVDTAAPLASQGDAEAGVDNVKRMTPLRVKQAIEAMAFTYSAPSGVTLTTGQDFADNVLGHGTIHASALGLVDSAVADQFAELADAITYCSTNRLKLDITGMEIRVGTQSNKSSTYKYLGDGDSGKYAIHETTWLAIVGKGTIGNLNENSDQTIFFCENCEYVEIGDGVTLDGYNTDGGYANAIQCYGCDWVHIGEATFYRNGIVRVGSSATGMSELCTVTRPRFIDGAGTHCIGSKPGGCKEWRVDSVYFSDCLGGINFEAQDENGFNPGEANWPTKITATVNTVVAEGINGMKVLDGSPFNSGAYAVVVSDTNGAIVNVGSISIVGGVGSGGKGGALAVGPGQDNLPPASVHVNHIHAVGVHQVVDYVPATSGSETTIIIDKVTGTYISNLVRCGVTTSSSLTAVKAISFGEVDAGILSSEFIVYHGLADGPFEAGETVTGEIDPSDHTATVVDMLAFNDEEGILVITGASGNFNNATTLTGGTSGATATMTFRPLPTGYALAIFNTDGADPGVPLISRLSIGKLRADTCEQLFADVENVTTIEFGSVVVADVNEALTSGTFASARISCTNFNVTEAFSLTVSASNSRGLHLTTTGVSKIVGLGGNSANGPFATFAGAGTVELVDSDLSGITPSAALTLTSTTSLRGVKLGSKTYSMASGSPAKVVDCDFTTGTVAQVSARTVPAGTRGYVTDANSPAFNTTLTGSGSTGIGAIYNGSNWIPS